MKSNVRLNAIKQIREGLVILEESIAFDQEDLSETIEMEIFISCGNDSAVKCYRDKIKELLVHLKKTECDSLKKKVLSGGISVKEFIYCCVKRSENSEMAETHNKSGVRKAKKPILAPPKINLHARSHSASLQPEKSNEDHRGEIKDAIKPQQEKVENKVEDSSKSAFRAVAFKNNKRANPFTQVEDKTIYNEPKNDNQINQIFLSNPSEVNEIEGIISSFSNQQSEVKDDGKKEEKQHNDAIAHNNNNEHLKQDTQTKPNDYYLNPSSLSSSPKLQKKRHYSYSSIHSNPPTQNLTNQLLELQILNQKAEAKSLLYQNELKSLRQELLSVKEQNLSLSMKNLQLTTELQLKSDTIAKLQHQLTSQGNLLNQYTANYTALKSKVEDNAALLGKKMNKFMTDFTQLSNKYDKSSLSKLQEKPSTSSPTHSKPKPQVDLFASNDISFAMFINKQA